MADRAYLPAAGRDAFLPFYDPLTRLLGGEKILRSVLDQAALQPNHVVLDIGCGTGTLAVLIKRLHPTVEVTGLDPDPKALASRRGESLEGARGRAFRSRLRRRAAARADATLRSRLSSMMFHHIPRDDRAKVLAEVRRVLAGRLAGVSRHRGFGTTRLSRPAASRSFGVAAAGRRSHAPPPARGGLRRCSEGARSPHHHRRPSPSIRRARIMEQRNEP